MNSVATTLVTVTIAVGSILAVPITLESGVPVDGVGSITLSEQDASASAYGPQLVALTTAHANTTGRLAREPHGGTDLGEQPRGEGGAEGIAASLVPPVGGETSAQLPCGNCFTDYSHFRHRFVFRSWTTNWCDNVGGCHPIWFAGTCYGAHSPCFIIPALENVESALAKGDYQALANALASSDRWSYNSEKRVLLFRSPCSQYVVAKYVLPKELAEVASIHSLAL